MKKRTTTIAAFAALSTGWFLYRNKKYPLPREYRALNKFFLPSFLLTPALIEKANKKLEGTEIANPPSLPEGITRKIMNIKTDDGKSIRLTLYTPDKAATAMPCLVYFHGGGFALADAGYIHEYMGLYSKKVNCKIVFVHYRTSDRHPFPVPFLDCYTGLRYVWDNSTLLNINRNKLAVGGDSSGGALAAAAALKARDEGGIKLCFQMLIYPVTDMRMQTESMKKYTDSPLWNARLNKKMWKLYLRNKDHKPSEYASPMLAKDFSRLPASYVEVEEFDCLRDEGIAYAKALERAGCEVQLKDISGSFHGFDVFSTSNTVREAVEHRCIALRRAFKKPVANKQLRSN